MNQTYLEARYLARRTKGFTKFERWMVALMLLFILCNILHFFVEPNIAVAKQEVIRDNAYYCNLIQEHGLEVRGATEEQVSELCGL
ncbi:hypothetical protein C4568_03685 [Candidatus Parcubacteria bacterium]|nr:MAG: hypothetical protein C4568_03685 [Candidatus Parcubacteria bacterium]